MNDYSTQKGLTLVELMVAMVVLLIAVAGTLQFLSTQISYTTSEMAKTRTSLSQMPAEMVLTRDVAMAGLGVPTQFSGIFVPLNLQDGVDAIGSNGTDFLQIVGAAMSSSSDDFYKWGYNSQYINAGDNQVALQSPSEFGSNGNSHAFSSEDVDNGGDRVIFLDAHSKELLSNQAYQITGVGNNTISLGNNTNFDVQEGGAIAYNMGGMNTGNFGGYIGSSGYGLGGTPPARCSPGTQRLLRVYATSGQPVMDCVLDFQVQIGASSGGGITWQNALPADPESNAEMVRIQIVHQYGKRDPDYQYPNNSITTANNNVSLNATQRQYHWRTKTMTIPLRELGI